jgi:hypothetical protein
MRVNVNTISNNDVINEFYLNLVKFIIFQLGIEFNFLKFVQNKLHMSFMFLHVLRETKMSSM